jgi:hypothetical protein
MTPSFVGARTDKVETLTGSARSLLKSLAVAHGLSNLAGDLTDSGSRQAS